MQNINTKDKTFSQWISEDQIEANLRRHITFLHGKNKWGRYGLDSRDLFHDVFVKLHRHNHPIPSRGKLFSLVSTTALNHLMDLSKKHSFRSAFFSKPMPTRPRPLPGSTLETVAAREPSPDKQAALRDEVEAIGKAAAQDPELALLFETISDLVGRGEATSVVNIGRTLNLPYKQAAKSIGKLRSLARGMR
jgi:DNA-directed RNA polymerase specialized sigma24 family protein